VLLDIDHSPRALLNARHGRFYTPEGLAPLAGQLKPDGVFAMWSDEAPDTDFERTLDAIFSDRRSHVVAFDNPLTGESSACTIYVARKAS
jgi:spermidine synthase